MKAAGGRQEPLFMRRGGSGFRMASMLSSVVMLGTFLIALLSAFLMPSGRSAHATRDMPAVGLNAGSGAPALASEEAPPPCPSDCNRELGWGRCAKDNHGQDRCFCTLGRGGPSCAFNITAIYSSLPVYDLTPENGLRQQDLQGWSPNATTYTKYLEKVNAVTVIEVGVWKGLSTLHMAKWLQKKRQGVLVAVDTWLGAPEFWGGEQMANATDERSLGIQHGWPTVYWTFLSNMIHQQVTKAVIPLPQTAKHATVILARHGIQADFIHIDAAHEYGQVKEDMQLYWGLLRPGGIFMGDDFRMAWPGVMKAAKEFALVCELDLRRDGFKWVIQKPNLHWFQVKKHLPQYCLHGLTSHYVAARMTIKTY